MSMIVNTKGGGGERVLPKTGLNQAVLVSIVDIGTQERGEYQGEKLKPARQAIITWSLTNQHHIFDEEKGAEPLHVSKWFTLSVHEKSALRKMVKSIRGKDIDGEFDLFSLLGANCMLNLVESNDGKYVNIEGFSPLMEGLDAVEGLALTGFSLTDFDKDVYLELHTWMKDRIRLSPEFQKVGEVVPDTTDIEETDIPF
jgi:hypothetical protein